MSPVRRRAVVLTAALMLGLVSPIFAADTTKSDVTDDLKYLPADTNLLFVIHMDKLIASDGFKKLRKEIPMIEQEMLGGFRKEFGFEITNVERMVYGGNAAGNNGPTGVFHLKTAVKPETIIKAASAPRFEGDKGMNYKEEKVGTNLVYVPSKERREAFCFLNDKTIVFGRAEQLKAVLMRDKKADLSTNLQAGSKVADLTSDFTMAMDFKAIAAAEKPPMIPGVDTDKIIANVTAIALNIKVGSDASLRGIAVCKDAKAAEEVKKEAENVLLLMTKFLMEKKVPKELVEIPGKIKLTTKGNLAEATGNVSVDLAIAFLKTVGPGPKPEPNPKPIIDE